MTNSKNNNEISMMIAAVYWMLNRSQALFLCDFYGSSPVSCQNARFGKARRCLSQEEDQEADLFKCCRMWASHLHLSVLIPSNTPPFYFPFFQIWEWSIPIINLVSMGFGAFPFHCKSPKCPEQYLGSAELESSPWLLQCYDRVNFYLMGKYCVFHSIF